MAIKRCKAPFSVWTDGVPRVISGGQLIEDTDPVYKGHEHLFEDVATYMSERDSRVEQATAGPGEKRSVAPAAKKAAGPAKKAAAKPSAASAGGAKESAGSDNADGGDGR